YGTTFKVFLPRVDEPAIGLPQPSYASQRISGNETVLLVEDEQVVRDLASRVLCEHGYSVLEAANGIAAIGVAQEYGARPIDLLLTDVIMPHMNGKALADQIVSMRPGTKVLYMSGYTDNVLAQNQQLGLEMAILQKPFSSTALLRKVREVLDL
ncbi:MAG TPA: response regulator, partial [Roseiflexaceae bacterium]|nr:response regulator [Roseiflexaceae bacterium]